MLTKVSLRFLLEGALFLGLFQSGFTQWSDNPDSNTAIAVLPYTNQYPQIINDGSGGGIIIWNDHRAPDGIFAQRIDSLGLVQWITNGIHISTQNGFSAVLTSDGEGGAIIAVPGDYVYAQRVNGSGVIQWTTNGIRISSGFSAYANLAITSDGDGGAIITWVGSNSILYAQKVNASGIVQWATNGIAVGSASFASVQSITSDNAGGAIIVWDKGKSYAQRVDRFGVVKWNTNGIAMCNAPVGSQSIPNACTDGTGGAIITWNDNRSSNTDIYVQRIDTSGNLKWSPDGLPICTLPSRQAGSTIVPDNSGGAIICWQDRRNGSDDIYAQKVNTMGNVQWDTNGVAICVSPSQERYQTITMDGSGGAIITWQDTRHGANTEDIYAQKVNSSGVTQWIDNGVAVSSAVNVQRYPVICKDDAGGAIITWEDYRNGSYGKIYAQRVNGFGNLGVITKVEERHLGDVLRSFELYQNYPNPFNPNTTILFSVSQTGFVLLKIYDLLGREVAVIVNEQKTTGRYSASWNASGLTSGVYFYQLQIGSYSETKKLVLLR